MKRTVVCLPTAGGAGSQAQLQPPLSSTSPLCSLFSWRQPSAGSWGGSGTRESPQFHPAAGQGGGGGTMAGPMRSRPLQCHLVPCPPAWSCVPVARSQFWEHRGGRKWKGVFSLMCLEMCKLVVSDPTKLSLLEVRQ